MTNKIKSWLSSPTSTSRAAILLMITMVVSNFLGLARNVILSKNIPLDKLDAYYAAFNVPDLIFNILILGTIGSAFIPVFNELMTSKEEEKGWEVANNFLNVSVLIIIVVMIGLFIFMDPVTSALVPGFDPGKHNLTVKLSRIMLLSPLLFSISYIIGGVLNSFKNFIAYSIAPLFYNIAIIIGAILAPRYDNIDIIAYAVVFGALAHFLIQIPSAMALGWRYKYVLNYKDQYLRRIYRLMIPRSIALAINQMTIIVFTLIGSTLTGGAIAIYKLTNDLQTTPTMIFATSLSVAVFPYITEKANQGDKQSLERLINKSVRMLLFVMIPTAILMIIMRAHIIRLYLALGTGFDNWDDTIRAIDTFTFFALSVVAQGMITLLARVYFAYQDTKSPMTYSLIGAVSSIIFAIIFSQYGFDVAGLALSFSLGSWINCILLFWNLKKHIMISLLSLDNILSVIKTIIIATIAGIFTRVSLEYFDVASPFGLIKFNNHTVYGLTMQTMLAGLTGVLVFIFLGYIFQEKEIRWLFKGKKSFTAK